ncbi:hypothetical protein P3X46_018664 [Hevea brasiliensis]|uniref:Uncharacterized protein n=1 Tax=Hevea brasiliensis TaxID=3981 RepID=A0ABQ9LRD6_HEVBR|nr:hypothetical protein P3X46_018664 [Hevea brasiliensis]
MAGPTSSSSSSEEDVNWKAAITNFGSKVFGTTSNGSTSHSTSNRDVEEQQIQNSQKLKPIHGLDNPINYEVQGPRTRPRILPGYDIDEKSKKSQLQSQYWFVAVDGVDIIAAAREAGQKALARLEAKVAAAKAKAKEEEGVPELKIIRGESWLPSIVKEIQINRNTRQKV